MRILIVPNAFKGGLSAQRAAQCIEEGLLKSSLEVQCDAIPIADGGDGTLDILAGMLQAEIKSMEVIGPSQQRIVARYGFMGDKKTGIIELAEASGLAVVGQDHLRPEIALTTGVGQLMNELKGCKEILLGVGGSATTDGGVGILQELGLKFYKGNIPLHINGILDIIQVDRIDASGIVFDTKIKIISDVENYLLGSNGAVSVYGPQKGIEELALYEKAMQSWVKLVKAATGIEIDQLKGGGASGGVPAGLSAFLNVKIVSGADYILKLGRFKQKLTNTDLVITTEGQIDSQSLQGKGPGKIAEVAVNEGVPTIGLCGSLEKGFDTERSPFEAVFSINSRFDSLEEAIGNTAENLANTAYNLGNLIAIQRQ
ncbi:MAG: glycerate kinase [Cyclobacteriaceae bacterium]